MPTVHLYDVSESVEVVFKARRLWPSSIGGLMKYAPCFHVVHGEHRKERALCRDGTTSKYSYIAVASLF